MNVILIERERKRRRRLLAPKIVSFYSFVFYVAKFTPFAFSKANFLTRINKIVLHAVEYAGEIASSPRAHTRDTVDPHLWVIIAHSCMPRDKSEATRKPAESTAVGSLSPLQPLFATILANSWIVAQPDESPLSVFCARGPFPLYWNIRPQHYGNYQGNGMSANGSHEGLEREDGRVALQSRW